MHHFSSWKQWETVKKNPLGEYNLYKYDLFVVIFSQEAKLKYSYIILIYIKLKFQKQIQIKHHKIIVTEGLYDGEFRPSTEVNILI